MKLYKKTTSVALWILKQINKKYKNSSSSCIWILVDGVTGAHSNRCTKYFDLLFLHVNNLSWDNIQYSTAE